MKPGENTRRNVEIEVLIYSVVTGRKSFWRLLQNFDGMFWKWSSWVP